MRTLTEAEARVVGALLGSTLVTERSRLHRAGVPRSTYHAARRRAYSEGWLRDRYIPNPVEFGLPFATFTLSRPFAERLGAFVQDRSRDGSVVFLASSPQLALAIAFHPTAEAASEAVTLPERERLAGWSFGIIADLREPSVPVYFDFEGSFSHLGEVEGAEGYPQGLGGGPPHGASRPEEFATRRRGWGAGELVRRPFQGPDGARAAHRIGPVGLPWGQRKLLNQGWMAHRVLLDPVELPPFRGRSAPMQVFVVGAFRANARPEELFAALTRDAQVYPFLFAVGGGKLLLGALGQPPATAGSLPSERASVMGVLKQRLEGIEILQEPAALLKTQIDHRYDRLFTPP